MYAADVRALTHGSDVVARGTVKRMTSRWTSDKSRIVTEVEVEVADPVKGNPPKTVIVVQPGGVVGDIGQKVSGLASFEEGEEVFLFLEKRPAERFLVAGMAQGKFRVERSSDGKAAYVVPERVEAMLIDPRNNQQVQPLTQSMKLEELVTQVKDAMREQAAPAQQPQGSQGAQSP